MNRVLAFVLFMASAMSCISDPPPSSRTAVTTARRPHPRQHLWAHEPLYERPTEAELHRYEAFLREPPRVETSRAPLVDTSSLRTIAAGQNLLRQEPALAEDVWRWNEVQDMATRQFGAEYPFLLETNIPSFAWSSGAHALLVNPRIVPDGTDAEIAGIFLSHEATHAVLGGKILTDCRFSSDEWRSFVNHCVDVDYEYGFVQETLAHLNEERWAHRRSTEVFTTIYRNVMAARHHRPGEFAQEMEEYIHGLRPGTHCGPPVIVRGPHRGEYCLPALVVDDEITLMVVNARN